MLSSLALLLLLAFYVGGTGMQEEEKKPVFLSAMVGESVIFSCNLDFPRDVVVPYTLNWNRGIKRRLTDDAVVFPGPVLTRARNTDVVAKLVGFNLDRTCEVFTILKITYIE
ncbi:hypothetical protein GE061_017049 [Apolygus lucorum]|uniref:Ig-like domain-containing protein n=1 Tax=Apolygus lucorum TaxID=248454 RepID=A0A8S9XJY5_APOLU|nr:hypothetical protein GE061_017049 [Apolygus lucorum]